MNSEKNIRIILVWSGSYILIVNVITQVKYIRNTTLFRC